MPETTPEAWLRLRTRLAMAVAARDMIEYQLGLLAAFGEESDIPEEMLPQQDLYAVEPAVELRMCRRLSAHLQRYKTMAVIHSVLVRGASWAQVGAGLGVTEEAALMVYGSAVERWREGDPAPWAPVLARRGRRTRLTGLPPISIDSKNYAKISADLDAYFARHVPAGLAYEVPQAITEGL